MKVRSAHFYPESFVKGGVDEYSQSFYCYALS